MSLVERIKPSPTGAALAGVFSAIVWPIVWTRYGGAASGGSVELVVATLRGIAVPAPECVFGERGAPGPRARELVLDDAPSPRFVPQDARRHRPQRFITKVHANERPDVVGRAGGIERRCSVRERGVVSQRKLEVRDRLRGMNGGSHMRQCAL